MQGRPIYIQHLGQINIKKIYEITTEERMLKFHVQEYERCIQYIMPACSKIAGKHIEQTFAILDVKGTKQHVSCLWSIFIQDQSTLQLMPCKPNVIGAYQTWPPKVCSFANKDDCCHVTDSGSSELAQEHSH